MSDEQWDAWIAAAQAEDVPVVDAETVVERHRTWSQAVTLVCDDGNPYVVKAIQPTRPEVMGRAMTAEQVVARLGLRLSAPIPAVALVNISQELIDIAGYDLQHLSAGLAHGLRLEPLCGGRVPVKAATTDRNKHAYGRLAVLYGWTKADDAQLIQKLDGDGDVFSVDHGHFLPGGPNWTAQKLDEDDSSPEPYGPLLTGAHPQALTEAQDAARATDDPAIAAVVGKARSEWGVPRADLVALARYLAARRDTL